MSDKPLAHPGLTDEQRALEAKIDDLARRAVEKRDVNGLSAEQDRWLRASLLPGAMPGSRFAAATEPHFNALLPAEAEILALIAEEAAEVVQAIGKTLRHGLESHYPGGYETNRSAVARELGDLRCAAMLAVESFVLDENEIATAARQKRGRVTKYLHHVKVDATQPTFHPAQASEQITTLTRTVEEQRATIERLTADLAETRACLATAREDLVKAWQEKDAIAGDLAVECAARRVEVAKCLAVEAERDVARRELAEARPGLTEREAFVLRWAKRVTARQVDGSTCAAALSAELAVLADRLLSAPSHQTSGTGDGPDDLSSDELMKAAAPRYSSRYVVDEWCQRLASEVRRRRRAKGLTVGDLAGLQLLHLGLSVIGEQDRVDLRLVDRWRELLAQVGEAAARAVKSDAPCTLVDAETP